MLLIIFVKILDRSLWLLLQTYVSWPHFKCSHPLIIRLTAKLVHLVLVSVVICQSLYQLTVDIDDTVHRQLSRYI